MKIRCCAGSVLTGGGSKPTQDSPEDWVKMVNGFQKGSLSSRLGIPMIYGIDAIHGHNSVYGATIFPHNIGLGATRQVNAFFIVDFFIFLRSLIDNFFFFFENKKHLCLHAPPKCSGISMIGMWKSTNFFNFPPKFIVTFVYKPQPGK